jgi:phosphopantetheine adenylyltransferase
MLTFVVALSLLIGNTAFAFAAPTYDHDRITVSDSRGETKVFSTSKSSYKMKSGWTYKEHYDEYDGSTTFTATYTGSAKKITTPTWIKIKFDQIDVDGSVILTYSDDKFQVIEIKISSSKVKKVTFKKSSKITIVTLNCKKLIKANLNGYKNLSNVYNKQKKTKLILKKCKNLWWIESKSKVAKKNLNTKVAKNFMMFFPGLSWSKMEKQCKYGGYYHYSLSWD